MIKISPSPHIGSSFDDFLNEQGMLENCERQALKEVLADEIRQTKTDQHISKTAMAENENK